MKALVTPRRKMCISLHFGFFFLILILCISSLCASPHWACRVHSVSSHSLKLCVKGKVHTHTAAQRIQAWLRLLILWMSLSESSAPPPVQMSFTAGELALRAAEPSATSATVKTDTILTAFLPFSSFLRFNVLLLLFFSKRVFVLWRVS